MPVTIEEVKEVAGELGEKFNELKSSNDKALDAVKGELAKTTDIVKKQAEIIVELQSYKSDLDAELKKTGRIGKQADDAKVEHRKAFEGFIRKGDTTNLEDLQQKALNMGANDDGGFALPEELDTAILDLLRDGTPMRSVCNQITVGGDGYKKLVNLHGTSSGWVGETAARPATNSPKLAELTPFMGEIYANPEATQKSLDDIFFNAEQWLESEIALEFMEQENVAFTSGDASNKPKGFLDYATAATADATRAFGTLEHLVSGASGAITADDVIRLIYKLKARYRMGASFMGNTNTLAELMVLKDTNNGQYLWRPGLEIGNSSTLRGYNFVENEDMPDVAAGANAIAFADFNRGYTIVDRMGTRTLRDPFTNKPYVGFYTTKRVGGMVTDSQAIKLIEIAA